MFAPPFARLRDILQRWLGCGPCALDHRQITLVKKLACGLHYRGQWCIGIGRQEFFDADDGFPDGRKVFQQGI